MTLYELQAVQRENNKLKSLYIELANHENFNPYKSNVITSMPKGNQGKNFTEWYAEERERILGEIAFCKRMIQEKRKRIDEFIMEAPYPECDIIRFRIINNLSWDEISANVSYSRSQTRKKFYDYINEKDKQNKQNRRNKHLEV